MLNLTLNSPTQKYFTEYQMLWDIKLNKIVVFSLKNFTASQRKQAGKQGITE